MHTVMSVVVWCMLVRRATLSIFAASFVWLQRYEGRETAPVWRAVRDEHRAARHLLPGFYTDLAA